MIRRRRGVLALALLGTLAYGAAAAAADISPTAVPVYHGSLRLERARGSLDPQSGAARFTVRRWRIMLAAGSNGMFPSQEPIVIAVGPLDTFRLEPGALRADRAGRHFRYRAPKLAATRGIVRVDMTQRSRTEYELSFTIADVALFQLTEIAPLCMPLAVIVGDDDGFSGVDFDRPGFPQRLTRRLTIRREPCTADAWPWT